MKTAYLFLLCSIALGSTAKPQTSAPLKNTLTEVAQKEYLTVHVLYESIYHLKNLKSFKKTIDKFYKTVEVIPEKKRLQKGTLKKYGDKIYSYLNEFNVLQAKQILLIEKLDTLNKLFTKVGILPEDEQKMNVTFDNLQDIEKVSKEILIIFSKLIDLFPEEEPEETEYIPTILTLSTMRGFFILPIAGYSN